MTSRTRKRPARFEDGADDGPARANPNEVRVLRAKLTRAKNKLAETQDPAERGVLHRQITQLQLQLEELGAAPARPAAAAAAADRQVVHEPPTVQDFDWALLKDAPLSLKRSNEADKKRRAQAARAAGKGAATVRREQLERSKQGRGRPVLVPDEEDIEYVKKVVVDGNRWWGLQKLWAHVRSDPDRPESMSKRMLDRTRRLIESQELHRRWFDEKDAFVRIPASGASARHIVWWVDLSDMAVKATADGYSWFMAAVNGFSRKVRLEPMKSKSTKDTAAALERILARTPARLQPDRIQHDNGKEWRGEFAALLRNKGITQTTSDSYKPQQNGAVEVVNQIVKRWLSQWRTQSENRRDWPQQLPNVEKSFNESAVRVLGGRTPDEVEKLVSKAIGGNQAARDQLDRIASDVRYEKGFKGDAREDPNKQLSSGGLSWSREPVKVAAVQRQPGGGTWRYQLVDKFDQPVLAFGGDQWWAQPNLLLYVPSAVPVQSDEQYVISYIVAPAIYRRGNTEEAGYVVRWQNYKDATVEKRSLLLQDVPKLVHQFDSRNKVRWLANPLRFEWAKYNKPAPAATTQRRRDQDQAAAAAAP